MNKFKAGDLVTLPNELYHGIYGRVWKVNGENVLVRFNGVQQVIFSSTELKIYQE